MFEDNDWNGQRTATAGQGIMRIFACYEEMSLFLKTWMLDFFRSSSGMMILMTRQHFKRKCLLKLLFVCHLTFLFVNVIWSELIFWNYCLHFNGTFVGKRLS